ncbi:hypothetical protein MCC01947_04870 [Bifidobacteriaceae bacterium MCC01947]|nr:hypothetical protein MCC01947_04870 [Bifidobacteriaceae bacterium MCC01947]GDZ01235.1 hypothetical protein MCC01941_04860 [Bifidobacteriaceae bacterium MCC01941]
MRHVTAHISIWNKLGWIGIICYFVFAAAAPEVLTEGNQWIGLCLAVLCVTLISCHGRSRSMRLRWPAW